MKTLDHLQRFGLDDLCQRFGIFARRSNRHLNLVLLKYNQISSPMEEPIVQECRGLIVDEADAWNVIARSYDKFFNQGEPNAAAIDWSTATVYEKLDGSLMTLYAYAGAWQVASSGEPDAAGAAVPGVSFADLFWKTWREKNYNLPPLGRTCLMFELMTPFNRVVVNHLTARLVFHGARDLETMRELDPVPIAAQYGWECVRTFPLNTLAAVLSSAAAIDPLAAEGYVVRDADFRRVKVKSPQYVALAHLKDCLSPRRMLEIIRRNEATEFLAYFPEMRPMYDEVKARFDAVCDRIEAAYAALQHIPAQRDFAAAALKHPFSAALFAVRAGKVKTVRQFFASATPGILERAMGMEGDSPPANS